MWVSASSTTVSILVYYRIAMMTLWTEQLTRAKDRYTKILAYLRFTGDLF